MSTFLNIDKIVSHVNKNYLAKANLYEVRIYGNNGTIADATPDITLNCQAVTIPGLSIGIVPDRRYGVGTVTNYAVSKGFTEINMTFYESEYEKERKYFVNWIDGIYNKKTGRMSYFKDYTKVVQLIQYNRLGEVVYKATMQNCYPNVVSPIDRGYAMDGIPQFTVALQVNEIDEEFFDKPSQASSTGLFGFLVDGISSIWQS